MSVCETCGKPLSDSVRTSGGRERNVCERCVDALEGKWGELSFDTNHVVEIVDGIDTVKKRDFSELPHASQDAKGKREPPSLDTPVFGLAPVSGDEDDDEESAELIAVTPREEPEDREVEDGEDEPAVAARRDPRDDDHDEEEHSVKDSGAATLDEAEVGVDSALAARATSAKKPAAGIRRSDDDDIDEDEDEDEDDLDDDDDEDEDEYEDEDEEEDEEEEDEDLDDEEEARQRPDSPRESGRGVKGRARSSAPAEPAANARGRSAEAGERDAEESSDEVSSSDSGLEESAPPSKARGKTASEDRPEGSRRKSTTERVKKAQTTGRSRRRAKDEEAGGNGDQPAAPSRWKNKRFLVQFFLLIVVPVVGAVLVLLMHPKIGVLKNPFKSEPDVTIDRTKDYAGQWKELQGLVVQAQDTYKAGLDAKRAIPPDDPNPNDPNRLKALELMRACLDLYNRAIPEGERILEENRKELEAKGKTREEAEQLTESFHTELWTWKSYRLDPQSVMDQLNKKPGDDEDSGEDGTGGGGS